jgi:hypothetical protein
VAEAQKNMKNSKKHETTASSLQQQQAVLEALALASDTLPMMNSQRPTSPL